MSPDPVSWFVIEHGWKVLAADGEQVGKVKETIGDSGKDIFNGIAVTTGLLSRARYVAAERVVEISEGCVRLDLSRDAFERLGTFDEPPPSAAVGPETTDIEPR